MKHLTYIATVMLVACGGSAQGPTLLGAETQAPDAGVSAAGVAGTGSAAGAGSTSTAGFVSGAAGQGASGSGGSDAGSAGTTAGSMRVAGDAGLDAGAGSAGVAGTSSNAGQAGEAGIGGDATAGTAGVGGQADAGAASGGDAGSAGTGGVPDACAEADRAGTFNTQFTSLLDATDPCFIHLDVSVITSFVVASYGQLNGGPTHLGGCGFNSGATAVDGNACDDRFIYKCCPSNVASCANNMFDVWITSHEDDVTGATFSGTIQVCGDSPAYSFVATRQ